MDNLVCRVCKKPATHSGLLPYGTLYGSAYRTESYCADHLPKYMSESHKKELEIKTLGKKQEGVPQS